MCSPVFTGESEDVAKTISAVDGDAPFATNLCFASTIVTNGSGECLVYATGMETQVRAVLLHCPLLSLPHALLSHSVSPPLSCSSPVFFIYACRLVCFFVFAYLVCFSGHVRLCFPVNVIIVWRVAFL